MNMAVVSAAGVIPTRLPAYIEQLRARYRKALGSTLVVAEETPQGQLIGLEAEALTIIDEMIVDTIAGMSLETAAGQQLDDFCSLLGIYRRYGTYTICEAIIKGPPDGTVIQHNKPFANTVGETFFSTGLTRLPAPVPLRATFFGNHDPDNNGEGLRLLVTDIGGVTSITPQNVILGSEDESDAQLRARYKQVLARGGGILESIRAVLLDIPGVKHARVNENLTGSDIANYCGTTTFPDKSIFAITDGGDVTQCAIALRKHKPLGIPAIHSVGDVVDIAISLKTTPTGAFPGAGSAQLGDRLYGWLTGTWNTIPGGGLDFGDEIKTSMLTAVASSVAGHVISSLTVTDDGSSTLTPSAPCVLYRADRNKITVELL